jgi:hypothetical protein
MKQYFALSLMSLSLLGIAPPSQAAQHENDKTTAKEVRQEVTDAAEAIKGYTADQRDEAAKKAKAALAALDARIDALEARIDKNWDKMDKAARAQARSTLQALRRQRVEAAEWYGQLQSGTAEAWEHTKKGFSDAYRSLQQAWEKAERGYQEDKKN